MLKEGDFVKINYDGYDDKDVVFDSTHGEIAKTLHGKEGPLAIMIGKDHLIEGLKEVLLKMVKGEKKEFSIEPSKAFGFRDKNLLRVLSDKEFFENEIMPHPGLKFHLDTREGRMAGVVKSVSGGRILADFNHPLADKQVRYKLELVDIITENSDKIKIIIENIGLGGEVSLKDGEAVIELLKGDEKDREQKKQLLPILIKNLISEIKEVKINEKTDGKTGEKPDSNDKK